MNKIIMTLALALGMAGAVPAFAETGDIAAALEGLKRQMVVMQQTIDAQNTRIQSLETRLAEKPQSVALSPGETTAPLSSAERSTDFRRDLENAAPWTKGVKFGGDLRLRQEYFDFYDSDAGSTGASNDRSRNRFRLRLRWGMEKDFGDDWKAGFRLATGNSTDNTSTNQTLGNGGYFTFKDIFVERAYAQVSPSALKDRGPLKSVTIGAGKVENPFERYSTGIVWDSDVTPEGLYEKADFSILKSDGNQIGLQATAGQFIVNENAGTETDAELFAYQAALTWSTKNFGGEKPVELSFAASFYDYPNFFQTVTSNSAGVSYLRTNTSALDDPQVLDFYPEAKFHFLGKPVTLWFDYAENVGSIDSTRVALNAVHGDDSAWGAGLKFGKAKEKGDWELFYGYYEIGANAVVAAFSDSDFGGPRYTGYTNRLGHKFGLQYRVTDNIAFGWTNYLVRPLSAVSSAVAASALDEKVWRSQADVSYKF